MKKNLAWFTAGALLCFIVTFLLDMRQNEAAPVAASADLEQSLDSLADSIKEAGQFVRNHKWYGSEREQIEAYRHILRQLSNALDHHAHMDPDFPYFQELNTRTKSGMDNSDQRYLIARLNGEGVYRVWGDRGGSRRLDITLYGEDDMAPSIATLTTDDLLIDEDGSIEVIIGGDKVAGNWLPAQAGPVRLLIRQIHSNWSEESPGALHIDRIDEARPTYPLLSSATLAKRIDATAQKFSTGVVRWPEMSRTRFAKLFPANTLTPPQDTGGEGGLAGRLMVGGHFELAEDEALIITAWPSTASYQGIQLGHHWWESLDYANRQSSLTVDQAQLSSDGAYHYVLSANDPGVPNWLDTEGFQRGVILMRYDGMPVAELPKDQHPSVQLVMFEELRSHLPADTPIISAEARQRAIAIRRQHVQQRFNY